MQKKNRSRTGETRSGNGYDLYALGNHDVLARVSLSRLYHTATAGSTKRSLDAGGFKKSVWYNTGVTHLGSADDREARALANNMHTFLIGRYDARPAFEDAMDPAFVEHEKLTARMYEERFGPKAREIAAAFRAKGAETRDVLFRHIDQGPEGESDVNAILVGLVRVSNALHVAEYRAAG